MKNKYQMISLTKLLPNCHYQLWWWNACHLSHSLVYLLTHFILSPIHFHFSLHFLLFLCNLMMCQGCFLFFFLLKQIYSKSQLGELLFLLKNQFGKAILWVVNTQHTKLHVLCQNKKKSTWEYEFNWYQRLTISSLTWRHPTLQ